MARHLTGALPLFEPMMTELTGGACSHHEASMCLMVKEYINIHLIVENIWDVPQWRSQRF